MGKSFFLIFLATIFFCRLSLAQATFESSDFATIDDSFIVSNISPFAIGSFDYTARGVNITWDYSGLTPISQEYQRFLDPNFTGFRGAFVLSCNSACYNDCYNSCVNAGTTPFFCIGPCNFSCGATCLGKWVNQFDLAEKGGDSLNLIIATIQDIYNFYDHTANGLYQVALGGRLSGFPIIAQYEQPDRKYKFPLEFGNRDTSNSRYAFRIDSIPGSSFSLSLNYSHSQQRINYVEGWGTLITPYGTFDSVIKVISEIHNWDTVVFQNNVFPLNPILPQRTIEYSWFSSDYGIPLLKVTANVINGTTIYTDLEFIDSVRCFDPAAVFGYLPIPGIIEQAGDSVELNFYNIGINSDQFFWNFNDTNSIANTATGSNPSHWFTEGGIYNVQLVSCNTGCSSLVCDTFSLPVLVIHLSPTAVADVPDISGGFRLLPNPFHDHLTIKSAEAGEGVFDLTIYDLTGKQVFAERNLTSLDGNPVIIGLKHLLAGSYLAHIQTSEASFVFKIGKAY